MATNIDMLGGLPGEGGITDAQLDQIAAAITNAADVLQAIMNDVNAFAAEATTFAKSVSSSVLNDASAQIQQPINEAAGCATAVCKDLLNQILGLLESATADAGTAGVFTQMVQQNAAAMQLPLAPPGYQSVFFNTQSTGGIGQDAKNCKYTPNYGGQSGIICEIPISGSGGSLPPSSNPPITPPTYSPPTFPPIPPSPPYILGPTPPYIPPTFPPTPPTPPQTPGPPCPPPIVNCPPCPPASVNVYPQINVSSSPTLGYPPAGNLPQQPPGVNPQLEAKSEKPPEKKVEGGFFGLEEVIMAAIGTSWNDPDSCPVQIDLTKGGGSIRVSDLLKKFGWVNDKGGWNFLAAYASEATVYGTVPAIFANVTADLLAKFMNIFVSILDSAAISGLNVPGCDLTKVQGPLIISLMSGIVSKWLGVDFPNATQSLTYQVNAHCPYNLPTQGEINTAWLGNTINDLTWQCWTRAIGNLDGPADKVLQSQRTRANIGDVISLFQRGLIDEATLRMLSREQGVTDQVDLDRLLALAVSVPAISDIIRFMTRDVFDKSIVDKYHYDDEFDKKYTADAEAMGKANGLSRETAKKYWRAHWQLPSNTQLYEMFHRLRHGRVATDLAVTRKDVEEAIRVNDMSPYWTPRLVEIAYRQLGRTDARRAYMVGAVDRKEFVNLLMDFGFDADNAEALALSTTQQKYKSILREKAYREYLAFQRNEIEMRQELLELGYEVELIDKAVVQSARTLKADTNKICLKSMRRMYMVYEEDKNTLFDRILRTGLSAVQANALLARWECERSARGKLIPATQLCYWYSVGLIVREEFVRRLRALGYSGADATRVALTCEHKALLRTVTDVAKEANKVLQAAKNLLPDSLQ